MSTSKKTETTEIVLEDKKFTKAQLLKANLFRDRRDILNSVILDDEKLTIEDVTKRIDEFMKRKVG